MKFRPHPTLLLILTIAFAPDLWAEAGVSGTVTLPKARPAPIMNKRYSMTAEGGMLATHPPVAVVYLEGSFPRPESPPQAQVMQRGIEFIPDLLAVQAGTRVEFPNRDSTVHSVYSASGPKPFNLGRFAPGARPVPALVFDTPGLVTLRCDIHENMRARILVLDTPYFVITDERGRYRLKALPAGHYVLKAWLDDKTTIDRPVDLQDGTVATVNFP